MAEDNQRSNQVAPAPPIPRMRPGGGHGAMGAIEKPKDFWKTLRNLEAYLKPFWFSLGIVFIFAITGTVFSIISPKILGNMTNQVVNDYIQIQAYEQFTAKLPPGTHFPSGTTGKQLLSKMPQSIANKLPSSIISVIDQLDLSKKPVMEYDKLLTFAEELIVLYVLSAAASYIQGWIMTNISQEITYRFRKDISEKINRLPLRYFDTRTFGEVLSRVTNDVDLVGRNLNQSLTQIVTAIVTIIGIIIMMLTINVELTLVSLVLIPLSFILMFLIINRSQPYFKEQQDQLGLINGHVEEMYGGHLVMRVCNGEKRSIAKFSSINKKLFESSLWSQFLSGLMMPIMNFISNLGFVAVSVLGGYLAVNNKIQIGDLQALIQYVNQLNQPVVQTANVANIMQSTAAAAERVFEFLGEEEEPDESTKADLAPVKGEVEFDHVVFGYDPEKVIIKDFSAKIKSGQRIAIVGPTGAGKTTMVNLLMRFYEVNKGMIKLDGQDIRNFKRSEVRKQFGMVLQDTWLFNGTIKENIAYGRPKATLEEVESAAKAAHADHFIHSLPHGYNMVLNEEGDNVSQGEKQLLTIARAMLADPPILILDEATSSVDTRTEIFIQKAMDNLMKDRTSFIIAHRLSTIRDADLILVMRDGNIVEQGKHQQLLDQNGFYASLYNSQFIAQEEI